MISRSRSLLAGTLLVCAAPLSATAQSIYSRTPDTLRFREVTEGEVRPVGKRVGMPSGSRHAATIAVVRLPGDSARAWFEDLLIERTGPMGTRTPSGAPLLNVPYTLSFTPRGRVVVLAGPAMPPSFGNIFTLAHQFDDFFPRLPVAPLRVGLAWTDTSERADSAGPRRTRWRSIAAYRVERDTVVNGVPALVVSMRQRLRVAADGPVPDTEMRAEVQVEGTDEGYFVFAPAEGRLLARRRRGDLQSVVTMRGGAEAMTSSQTIGYTSAVEAER